MGRFFNRVIFLGSASVGSTLS